MLAFFFGFIQDLITGVILSVVGNVPVDRKVSIMPSSILRIQSLGELYRGLVVCMYHRVSERLYCVSEKKLRNFEKKYARFKVVKLKLTFLACHEKEYYLTAIS